MWIEASFAQAPWRIFQQWNQTIEMSTDGPCSELCRLGIVVLLCVPRDGQVDERVSDGATPEVVARLLNRCGAARS